MKRSLKQLLAVLGLSALALACNPFGGEGDINITNTNTNTNEFNPAPQPSPSASPSPGANGGPIVRLKITFFTENGNGDKQLVVGQKGTITATPLDANGIDPCKGIEVCSAYGQQDIVWIGGPGVAKDCDGSAIVAESEVEEEAYNRDLKACAEGSYTISAVFKGTIPGSLTGTVVAAPK